LAANHDDLVNLGQEAAKRCRARRTVWAIRPRAV